MFSYQCTSLGRRSWVLVIIGTCLIIASVAVAMYVSLSTTVNAFQLTKGWAQCNKYVNQGKQCCYLENDIYAAYDKLEYICCNKKLERVAHDVECCASGDIEALYDKKEKTCCEGKVYNKIPGHKCCYDKIYNIKTHFCCEDNSVTPKQFYTFRNITSRSTCPTGYCGGKPYWGTENKCCNGALLPGKTDNHSCCGDTLYHRHTEICCDGRKHKKTGPNRQCCGRNYLGEGERCCGEKSLEKDKMCCDKTPYNPQEYVCIEDKNIVSIETPLCANLPYDPKKQVCCDNISTLPRNNPGDDKCCKVRNRVKESRTFNSKTSECKDSKVYSTVKCGPEHSKEIHTCCNGFAYEQPSHNSVCCDAGRAKWLKRKNPDHENCWKPLCNNEWFDHDTHDCCNNSLINKRRERCINNESYEYYKRRDWELSDLRVCGPYVMSDKYNCCANLMPYNLKEHTCPINEFGNERPFKTPDFPFWPLIKCRSKRKTGKIVKIEENHGKITFVLKARKSRKEYTVTVSNKQKDKFEDLKKKKCYVNVYYERPFKNNLFLGEFGAIERKPRRTRHKFSNDLCVQINKFFQKGSN